MSKEYDEYLVKHKNGVYEAFKWLKENIPDIFEDEDEVGNIEWNVINSHDYSKNDPEEYDAYDTYFYGNRSFKVVQDFNKAWLRHIHHNLHHWQHWILVNDEPDENMVLIDMPHEYIIEMICDWWSFSFRSGNLTEVFEWYDNHSDYMKLSDKTRKIVEDILSRIKGKIVA